MNNEEQWITKKELVTPIVSIIAFLLMIVGASYAYYTVSKPTVDNNSANMRAQVNLNFGALGLGVTVNSCVVTVGQTVAGMTPAKAGNYVSNQCTMNVSVTGSNVGYCYYTVSVKTNTATDWAATRYVANSISYTISTTKSRTVAETKIGINGVTTSGTAVLANYTLYGGNYEAITFNVKAYNLNTSQDVMSGKTYFLYLHATPTCAMT